MTQKSIIEKDACGVGGEVDLRGVSDFDTFFRGLQFLIDNHHRGGETPGSDGKPVGDGASLGFRISDVGFFQDWADKNGVNKELEVGQFGVGNFFLPKDEALLVNGKAPEEVIKETIEADERFLFLGWRDVEVDEVSSDVSIDAIDKTPRQKQAIYAYKEELSIEDSRKLDIEMREKVEKQFEEFNSQDLEEKNRMNTVSFSSEYITYKGMQTVEQFINYFKDFRRTADGFLPPYEVEEGQIKKPDLSEVTPLIKTSAFQAHNRMSTNTAPEASRAHSGPVMVNGERNTNEGNLKQRRALNNESRGGFSLDVERGSDSYAMSGGIAETIYHQGVPLSQASIMTLQPAFENDPNMSPNIKAMFKVWSMIEPPSTGPTHLNFMNSEEFGSVLDANGLRPARYLITMDSDGKPAKLYIGSEDMINVRELAERGEFIMESGKLEAGQTILAREENGKVKIYKTKELLESFANPELNGGIDYEAIWNNHAKTIIEADHSRNPEEASMDLESRKRVFQWDQEALENLLHIAENGKIAKAAMGDDRQRFQNINRSHLVNHYKQLFAQITNPPLDALKERDSFSLSVNLGENPDKHFEIAKDGEDAGKKWVAKDDSDRNPDLIALENGFLMDGQLEDIEKKSATERIDITYEMVFFDDGRVDLNGSIENYEKKLEQIKRDVTEALANGAKNIILSDKNVGPRRQTIADIRALDLVRSHIEKSGNVLDASIIIESGQVKDTHHYAMLAARGASAVDAYMMRELLHEAKDKNLPQFKDMSIEDMKKLVFKGTIDQMLKIMAKMGITNFKNYSDGNLVQVQGIDTEGMEGYENDGSPIKGLNEKDLAFKQIYAFALNHERLNVLTPLTGLIEDQIKQTILISNDAEIGPALKAGIEKRFNDILDAQYLKDPEKKSNFLGNIVLDILVDQNIIPEKESALAIKAGKPYSDVFAKQFLKEIDKFEVIARTSKLDNDLVNMGRFSNQVDPMTHQHRFGNEMVQDINHMYNISEAKREPKIKAALAEFKVTIQEDKSLEQEAIARLIERQREIEKERIEKSNFRENFFQERIKGLSAEEVAKQKPKILEEVKVAREAYIESKSYKPEKEAIEATRQEIIGEKIAEKEFQLRQYMIADRDENGRITKKFIENYQTPSGEYREFSNKYQTNKDKHQYSIRDMMKPINNGRTPVSLSEFKDSTLDVMQNHMRAGQISFGAEKEKPWKTQVAGINNVLGNSSAGEGGELVELLGTHLSPKNKQIASSRFGQSAEMLLSIKMVDGQIQVKMMQGAKPGEGGEMPAGKVKNDIAGLRQSTPGVGIPSPAPMHDIYSIEELKQLIYDLKSAGIKVDVKIGAQEGAEFVAVGAVKCGCDTLTIAGHDGGTGAAGIESQNNTGDDWTVGTKILDALKKEGLRDKAKVFVEGGIADHRDMLVALALGFDGVGQGTMLMIQNKCIMARVCFAAGIEEDELAAYREKYRIDNDGKKMEELSTQEMLDIIGKKFCPVGLTNSEHLFKAETWRIEQFQLDMASALREDIAALGYSSVQEFIDAPRKEKLQLMEANVKIFGKYDFSSYLDDVEKKQVPEIANDNDLNSRTDDKWLSQIDDHFKRPSAINKPIVIDGGTLAAKDRSVGIRSAVAIAQYVYDGKKDMEVLPDRKVSRNDLVTIKTNGNAGLSYGAWNTHGQKMVHTGVLQNDVGKSQNGGIIVATHDIPENHPDPSVYDNAQVIAGNNVAYGAYGGDRFLAGKVGSRANICCHGGRTVVKGAGDYQCEFMTNGTYVNLSSEYGMGAFNGMIGGIGFQYDPDKQFDKLANLNSVRRAEKSVEKDLFDEVLRTTLEDFHRETGDKEAKRILDNFEVEKENFVTAIPVSYDKFVSADQVSDLLEVAENRKTYPSSGKQTLLDIKGLQVLNRVLEKTDMPVEERRKIWKNAVDATKEQVNVPANVR